MKKIFALILALCMVLSLSACGGGGESRPPVAGASEGDTWAVYWYLCGSNLETDLGAASNDLSELLSEPLPEGVSVVVQTGGAKQWQNGIVDASRLERYVVNSGGMELVDSQPSASMGESETLEAFLSFARENYPAEHTMLLFWDHGSGSVGGVCFDELFDDDHLTLPEIYSAVGSVWETDAYSQPIDIVGFDACLMATIDTAFTFSDVAKYLVASEELEPSSGWNYAEMARAFAGNPSIEPEELGRTICDGFMSGCEAVGAADSTTLSLVSLSDIQPLLEAYAAFGDTALTIAGSDSSFYSVFARAANSAENYGGNNPAAGYSNLVDLGDFAYQTADIMPEQSQAISDALAQCVVYSVNGPYCSRASGLSCYYPYDMDVEEISALYSVSPPGGLKVLYSYEAEGELDEDGTDYLQSLGVGQLQAIPTIYDYGWKDAPLTLTEDGYTQMTLGAEADAVLASVAFDLFYTDSEGESVLYFGTDNDIIADWENGVFSDNFRGVWGALDGCVVNMVVTYESEEYNTYDVPILLNGEPYYMMVAYDFEAEAWYVLCASPNSGGLMAAKEMRQFEVGDEITILHYIGGTGESEELEPYAGDTVIWGEDTVFSEAPLPDGKYFYEFVMTDTRGGRVTSAIASFEMSEGEIMVTVE